MTPHLAVGAPCPPFALTLQDGSPITEADLSSGVVVLYFYPKDDTPGCTAQACAFRDLKGDFASAGARIFGVSADDEASHIAFIERYRLNFPLIADPEAALCKAVGVWGPQSFQGHEFVGISRTTFVLREGRVTHVFPNVTVAGHMDAVLAVVRGLS